MSQAWSTAQTADAGTTMRDASADERALIENFIFRECRLADESRYEAWEALVDDDMYYWIPRGEGDFDLSRHVSITADNRSRLSNRIRQLMTGTRHSQSPPSPMRRLVSNIEAYVLPSGEFVTFCNFVLYEMRVQSTDDLCVWPGRIEYRLRRRDDGLRMFFKKVVLVNGAGPLPSLGFIL
jgi:3-phenylpropionate/cinnamic acid dioxygenase small subunit